MFPADANPRWLRRLEKKAARIEDPVRRLRFLREQTSAARRCHRGRRLLAQFFAILLPAGMLGLAGMHSRWEPHLSAHPAIAPPAPPPALPSPTPSSLPASPRVLAVWLVDSGEGFEAYSNGLRVDTSREISGLPRRFQPLFRLTGAPGDWQSNPVGIVFHSSESELAPFTPETTAQMKRRRAGLLDYASRIRAYHYVIDRFGAVYRLVAESSPAHHAGHSIWGDDTFLYLQLNRSFLGVAFESESLPEGGIERLTEAQVRAGRALVEMLRSRYGIAAHLCVTHAQVSVNPANSLIGYHTDWASGFPFAALGLPDNYRQPLPSVAHFGFRWDEAYWNAAAPALREALLQSQHLLRERSLALGIPTDALRRRLQRDYQVLAPSGSKPSD